MTKAKSVSDGVISIVSGLPRVACFKSILQSAGTGSPSFTPNNPSMIIGWDSAASGGFGLVASAFETAGDLSAADRKNRNRTETTSKPPPTTAKIPVAADRRGFGAGKFSDAGGTVIF